MGDLETAATWYPIDNGTTIGTTGSEGGVILRDEEHSAGMRITLERAAHHAPFGITCGIYGCMLHTTFASSPDEAEGKYWAMKARLAAMVLLEGDEFYDAVRRFCEEF